LVPECRHNLLFFLWPEPAVKHAHLKRGKDLLHVSQFSSHSFDANRIAFFDVRANHIRLPTLSQFAPNEVPNLWQSLGTPDERANLTTSGRGPVNHRSIEIAIERQTERARDRGGSHHQQVRVRAFAQ